MDFGLLPPEVNSSRMYSGPGSESMLSAATAWDGLAATLQSAAVSYGSVITGLSLGSWLGPASAAMAAAARPYAAWLLATAAQAAQTAAQAKMAAGAYETAFTATVPPPLIAANRSELTSLAGANLLGQNSPAIEALQAEYAEMWAQDAGAMYGYAGTSQAATALTPFAHPVQTSSDAGQAAAAGAKAAKALASASPTSLASALAALPAAAGDFFDVNALNVFIADIGTADLVIALVNTARPWTGDSAESSDNEASPSTTQGNAVSAVTPAPSVAAAVAPVADVGHAALVGALTVPHSWAMAAPEVRLAVEALPNSGLAPISADFGGAPAGLLGGMAMAGMTGRGAGGPGTRAVTTGTPDEEGQPARKPTVVVLQPQPQPNSEGPKGHRPL
jgi:PPE-repeat protein